MRSTASKAVLLRTSKAGLSSITSSEPSRPLSAIISMHSCRLGSLDVMELNPAFDVRNKTALLAVDLIASLFGKSTLMRASA